MPTVVIVGRKNVGKSTLFNRVIGRRLSIVYKEPGITRDRIYGEVEWRGCVFNIIDTGGFYPDEDDTLAKKINRQIIYGLEEADLIYFVVDGKSGLKPGDMAIAEQIRKIGKKVFLLVNKIDTPRDMMKSYEFSELGFTPSFSIAAESGIRLDDVLDETLNVLPHQRKSRPDTTIDILILGRPNAGKSTLLNVITKSERAIVDEKPGTTRDLVNASFTYRGHDMKIIDTCGLKRFARIKEPVEFYSTIRAVSVIEKIDVAVVLFDTTQGVVDQDRRIASMVLSKAKGLVIAPNKIDLIGKKDVSRITSSTYHSFKSFEFVPVVPISARLDTGIDTLLNQVLNIYRENRKTVDKGVLKNLVERLQPPVGGTLISLKQTKTAPPIFTVLVTCSVKDNYIAYIRKSLRDYFGFSGVPILIKTRAIKRFR